MNRKRQLLTGAALLIAGAAVPTAAAGSAFADAPVSLPATGPLTGSATAPLHPDTRLQQPQLDPTVQGVGTALPYAVHPVTALRLDPFAQSAIDPLTNGATVQPDNPGVPAVSSLPVTAPLSNGGGVSSLLGGLGG